MKLVFCAWVPNTEVLIVCSRGYIFRQPDAKAGLRDDAGPAAGRLWQSDGRSPLLARSLWRGLLGRRHPRRTWYVILPPG